MHVYRLLHRNKKGGHIATLGKGTVTRKMTRILSTNRKEIEECLNAFLPDFSATNQKRGVLNTSNRVFKQMFTEIYLPKYMRKCREEDVDSLQNY